MEVTQVMTASVSVIEMFRRWEHEEDESWEDFLIKMSLPASPQMEAGKAFHSALEHAIAGDCPTLDADGFTFDFSQFDGELAMGQVSDIPVSHRYGDLLVRGRCDDVTGGIVTDFKLTFSSFDAERYLESVQWRFYLDMLKANQFVYQVFEGYQRKSSSRYRDSPYLGDNDSDDSSEVVDIKKLHTLRLYRYPEMEADCHKLATRFHEVALRHPQIAKIRELSEV